MSGILLTLTLGLIVGFALGVVLSRRQAPPPEEVTEEVTAEVLPEGSFKVLVHFDRGADARMFYEGLKHRADIFAGGTLRGSKEP